ncbi:MULTISPECIES: hypothetical protein [Pseudomonas]|uniref:hypothetical protein n=1 Tax=Pseudomonas TaxID=286 RepID=UPI000490469C|nr:MULTISPECIES: hypothetical protein [Pseudomonas]MCE1010343.1 hypothetical protein [Pseudomonas monteilii]
MKSLLATLRSYVFPDNRSDREKEEEKQFIEALNQLKTLTVTPQGKMSIDPEEIRDQILKSREAYRDFVDPLHRRRR